MILHPTRTSPRSGPLASERGFPVVTTYLHNALKLSAGLWCIFCENARSLSLNVSVLSHPLSTYPVSAAPVASYYLHSTQSLLRTHAKGIQPNISCGRETDCLSLRQYAMKRRSHLSCRVLQETKQVLSRSPCVGACVLHCIMPGAGRWKAEKTDMALLPMCTRLHVP